MTAGYQHGMQLTWLGRPCDSTGLSPQGGFRCPVGKRRGGYGGATGMTSRSQQIEDQVGSLAGHVHHDAAQNA